MAVSIGEENLSDAFKERRHYVMHAFDRMRQLYDYDTDTTSEDGVGGAVVLVDGPPGILSDSVSHRIAPTTWAESGYTLEVDDYDLDRYLLENFENKDGAPVLSDEGFTDTNYLFNIIPEDVMEEDYRFKNVYDKAKEKEWGSRHLFAMSTSLQPGVQVAVLSETDGSIRNFMGKECYEYDLGTPIVAPRTFSGLPIPERHSPYEVGEVHEDTVGDANEAAVQEFDLAEEGQRVPIIGD